MWQNDTWYQLKVILNIYLLEGQKNDKMLKYEDTAAVVAVGNEVFRILWNYGMKIMQN